jgi:hypothetical protein
MAVSYECEQCNSPRVPPSAGSVSSKRRAFARLPSLVPKPRAHGGTANFALECESELDGRGTAPHVSSDQETWRPEVIPNNGQQSPLSPLHRQRQFRLPMHKALGHRSFHHHRLQTVVDTNTCLDSADDLRIDFKSDSRFAREVGDLETRKQTSTGVRYLHRQFGRHLGPWQSILGRFGDRVSNAKV